MNICKSNFTFRDIMHLLQSSRRQILSKFPTNLISQQKVWVNFQMRYHGGWILFRKQGNEDKCKIVVG